MKPIIAANWKMNLTLTEVQALLEQMHGHVNTDIPVILCPSACYFNTVAKQLPLHGALCAQTISEFESGAYTGEVSVVMAKSCGVTHTLLGHSERRHVFNETNSQIEKKLELCQAHQITPILCVGETLDDRDADNTAQVVQEQLAVLDGYSGDIIIAYEPVWAIGTGKTATPDMAQAVHADIRKRVGGSVPILYGGSVNAENIQGLLAMSDINGALVGGASLKGDTFSAIVNLAQDMYVKEANA
jgi:triosephosphate isomerase (TIM)